MSKQFSVPDWFLTILKLATPALGVGVFMYIQLALMQKDLDSVATAIRTLQTASETRTDAVGLLNQRVANLEIKQAVEGKSISDALGRIEGTMKDMQSDMKDINRRIDGNKR